MSNGRFELGLGAGGFWDAIAAMGGSHLRPGASVDALEEAITIIRLALAGERSVVHHGEHYRLDGYHPGPLPAHDVGLWIGAYKPRMLNLVGRLADGWVPSLSFATRGQLGEMTRAIDEAANVAGRKPSAIRRILNVAGGIGETIVEGEPLAGPPTHWVEQLAGLAEDFGFDSFIFAPTGDLVAQVERFAEEVVPGVRAALYGKSAD